MSLLLLLLLSSFTACAHTHPYSLYKCCSIGEVLDPSTGDGTSCRRLPSNNNNNNQHYNDWIPLIFSPGGHKFLPKNELPANWLVKESTIPVCRNSVSVTVVSTHPQGHHSFVLFDNGSILIQEYAEMLNPGTFCVDLNMALVCLYDNVANDMTEASGGPATMPRKRVRIKKCCGDNAVFSEKSASCVSLSRNSTVNVPSLSALLPSAVLSDHSNVSTVLTTGFPSCSLDDLVIGGKMADNDASLKADGSMLLNKARATLKPGDFCLEHTIEHLQEPANVVTCHAKLNAGIRHAYDNPMDADIRFTLYPLGLVLSVFFLAATLATGFLLPGTHHVLHWRCQTSHVACLLVGDVLLATVQLMGSSMPPLACIITAVTMHFFFLAAFFWLNTMCFNIWWTFRDLRPASLDKSQEVCRLRLYELYAWGGPLAIAASAAIVDNLPEDYSGLIRPRFGHHRCWFYGDMEIFCYFYAPVGLLLLLNMVLFVATARELTCGLWKREVVKSHNERATLGRVCLKLVVVMGLTWVADVISWAAGGPQFIWYLTDLINALQGVFIFVVVGCQPQVWAAVNRLWCWRIPRAGTANIGHQLSTYSQGLPSLGESVIHSPPSKNLPRETMC